jgi:N utilization substance protein A
MEVVVEDKQLSLAIGKKGQNVRLAAKLTGWRIDIKSEEEKRREVEAEFGALGAGDAADDETGEAPPAGEGDALTAAGADEAGAEEAGADGTGAAEASMELEAAPVAAGAGDDAGDDEAPATGEPDGVDGDEPRRTDGE